MHVCVEEGKQTCNSGGHHFLHSNHFSSETCGDDHFMQNLISTPKVYIIFLAVRQEIDRFVCTLQTLSSRTKHIVSRSNMFNYIIRMFLSKELLKVFVPTAYQV